MFFSENDYQLGRSFINSVGGSLNKSVVNGLNETIICKTINVRACASRASPASADSFPIIRIYLCNKYGNRGIRALRLGTSTKNRFRLSQKRSLCHLPGWYFRVFKFFLITPCSTAVLMIVCMARLLEYLVVALNHASISHRLAPLLGHG